MDDSDSGSGSPAGPGPGAGPGTSPVPPNCVECGRYKLARHPFFDTLIERGPADGPVDILSVGQHPGYQEDYAGKLFTGTTSAYLRRVEARMGLERFTMARQNAVRCAHPNDEKPTEKQITLCRPFLAEDIKRLKPKLILAMGDAALKATAGMKGITKRRGIPITAGDTTILPMFHPAAADKDKVKYEPAFLQDMVQARELILQKVAGVSTPELLRPRYHLVRTLDEAVRWVQFLKTHPHLTYDSEFEPLNWLDPNFRVLMMQFGWGPKTGVAFPVDHPESPFLDPAVNQILKGLLVTLLEHAALHCHNAPVDVAAACHIGADIAKLTIDCDTMLLSLRAKGKDAAHGLKALAFEHADTGGYEDEVEAFKDGSLRVREVMRLVERALIGKGKPPPMEEQDFAAAFIAKWGDALYDEAIGYSTIPMEILARPYACADVDTTWQVEPPLLQRLTDTGQTTYFRSVYRHLWQHHYLMQRDGMLVDWDAWVARHVHYSMAKAEIADRLRAIPEVREFAAAIESGKNKKKFSLKSGDQMRTLLFDILKLPEPPGRTEKTLEIAIDAGNMQWLADNCSHPIVAILQENAGIVKKLETLQTIADNIHPDGKLHAQFHSFVHSGRRGSRDPNVQNLTLGDKEDPWSNLRMCITAGAGRVFISPDYKQLEFRLAALYSNDENMIDCCLQDDPHQKLATELDIPRKPAKTTNFAMIYDASAATLAAKIYEDLGIKWSEDYAEKVRAGTRALYKTLFDYIGTVHKQVRMTGYVVNVLGHRRDFPQVLSHDTTPKEMAAALREAWNHCCQSLGHDILTMVMLTLQRLIWDMGWDWQIVNDNHDGFLLNTPEADAMLAAGVCQALMESIPTQMLPATWNRVPLLCEVSRGTHYGNLKEIPRAEIPVIPL